MWMKSIKIRGERKKEIVWTEYGKYPLFIGEKMCFLEYHNQWIRMVCQEAPWKNAYLGFSNRLSTAMLKLNVATPSLYNFSTAALAATISSSLLELQHHPNLLENSNKLALWCWNPVSWCRILLFYFLYLFHSIYSYLLPLLNPKLFYKDFYYIFH